MYEGASLTNLLIVDGGNGEVYFVEDKTKKPMLADFKKPSTSREIDKFKSFKRTREVEEVNIDIKQEIKDEPTDETPDDYDVYDYHPMSVYVEHHDEEVPKQIKAELDIEIKDEEMTSFDGNFEDSRWSENEYYEDYEEEDEEEEEYEIKRKRKVAKKSPSKKTKKLKSAVRNLKCFYCDSVFPSMNDKKLHTCKYLQCPPGKFICRFCGVIRRRKALSDHMRKKHGNEESIKIAKIPFQCDLCGNHITKYENLKNHMQMHLKIPYAICTMCGAQCFSPSGWKKHSCFRKLEQPNLKTIDTLYCRYCNNRFPSAMEKKSHKCDFQIDRLTKICRVCHKTVSKNSFNHHLQVHSQEIHSCHVCEKQFNNKRCLKVHLQQHEATRRYKCDKCPESFVNKSTLEHHKRFHGEEASKRFTCEFCSRTLCSDFSLRGHIQRNHSTSKLCEICKFEAPSKQLMKEHIKEVHGTFNCTMCSKQFALPRYLRAHERTHFEDNTPRITCPVCFKGLLKWKIKSHVFRLHNEHFSEWQKINPEF